MQVLDLLKLEEASASASGSVSARGLVLARSQVGHVSEWCGFHVWRLQSSNVQVLDLLKLEEASASLSGSGSAPGPGKAPGPGPAPSAAGAPGALNADAVVKDTGMDLSLAEDLFAEVRDWAPCDLFLPSVSWVNSQ